MLNANLEKSLDVMVCVLFLAVLAWLGFRNSKDVRPLAYASEIFLVRIQD